MSALNSFFAALNEQEEYFRAMLKQDNLGLLMRCAINELDWYYYNYAKAENPTEDQHEQFYLLHLGTARLIKLALEARKSFDVPVVTTRRHRDLTIPVLEISSGLGMIQHGRRVAQGISHGLGTIEQTAAKEFVVTLPQEIEDEDYYEREVHRHYINESRRLFTDELIRSAQWKQLSDDVEKMLYDLVYPFAEHYIGYDADPLLDNYFYALAHHELSLQEGYDTYHYTTRFGGVRIQSYMEALTYLISISMRHERFAEALVKKAPEVKLENTLTISADIDPFVTSFVDAVNYFGAKYEDFEPIDFSQAQQIFDVLSYSRENTTLLDAPGSPYPLLVKCSDTGVIRSIFGAKAEPVRFLLESLRFHFPQDYDKNQSNRESSLQRGVRRVLDETFSDLEYRENLPMRLDGRVLSDIDLVVIDRPNRTMFLCQLKHQELYGSDLHAKAVRSKRLRTQIEKWLDSLDNWIANIGIEGLLEAVQLPKRMTEDLSLFQIVISRHFAYPLKEVVTGHSKAFANWDQFYNAVQLVKDNHPEPTLRNLVEALQDTQFIPETVTHLPEPRSKWHINDLVFVIEQEDGHT